MPAIPVFNISSLTCAPQIEINDWGKRSETYDPSTPHRHRYFEILFFIKGTGLHEVSFRKNSATACSLHFVAPDMVHVLQRSANSLGKTLIFSPDFLNSDPLLKQQIENYPFFSGSGDAFLNLSAENFNVLLKQAAEIKEELNANTGINSVLIIRSLLTLILTRIYRLYQQALPENNQQAMLRPRQAAQHPAVKEFKELIEKSYSKHLTVEEYADQLNISAKHLNACCKKELSMNASTVIKERVLLEVKKLLAYSEIPVKEIAWSNGFEDPAHFSRFFKSGVGITPVEYREALR